MKIHKWVGKERTEKGKMRTEHMLPFVFGYGLTHRPNTFRDWIINKYKNLLNPVKEKIGKGSMTQYEVEPDNFVLFLKHKVPFYHEIQKSYSHCEKAKQVLQHIEPLTEKYPELKDDIATLKKEVTAAFFELDGIVVKQSDGKKGG